MLLLWTKHPASRTLSAVGSVIKHHTDLNIQVHADMSSLPNPTGMTALLCMGSEPLSLLQEHKIVPKNRTVTSLRSTVLALPNTKALGLVTYSPGIADVDYGHFVDLLCDVGSAVRLAKTGSIKPVYGNYKYVPDLRQFRAEVEALYVTNGKPVEVSLDLETLGLDPYAVPRLDYPGAYIISIQASHTAGKSDLVYFDNRQHEEGALSNVEFLRDLHYLLSSPTIKLRGANLKFDLHWLFVRAGIECTNFVFDTTLVGSLLDENRGNGLDVHCKIYAPSLGGYSDFFDRTVDKSRMDKVPKADLLLYAGGDSDATLQVAAAQKTELLKDPQLTRFYVTVLHPAARAFERVERTGVLVDQEAYKELRADLCTEVAQLIARAKPLLGGRIVAKHFDVTKQGGLNLQKASLLTDFMFSPMGLNLTPKMVTEKTGAPSTALEHLLLFHEVPEAKEFVSLLKDYASAQKTLQTYVDGFLSHLRSDGRFHASYWFFAGNKDEGDGGTVTGRLSAKDPALQTVPKHTKWAKRLRRCLIAPPGYVVVERDYSQGELRVVACIANELTMIKAYRENKDLHVVTGASLAGMSYDAVMALQDTDPDRYDSIRQPAKPANFGLLYGQFPEGFRYFAEQNYGVKMSLDRAVEIRDGFFELYPGLPRYHEEYKSRAHRFGEVRTPMGRIRHLPLINSRNRMVVMGAERQAINSPVQGCLSDMLLWAIALEEAAGLSVESPSFGAIHDAAYTYMPEDKVDILLPQHMDIMQNLPFEKVGWNPQLQFIADAKYGPNMADLKKWKP